MRLVIGGTAGSTGQYELSETGALHVGLFEIVGDEGQGSVTQTGGTHTAGGLIVAQQADSSGSFELSGGSLETSVETIGWFGTAEFHQTGGTHVVDGLLMLGAEADSDGRYEMSGGSLEADSVVVGDGGLGVFSQVDGTVSAREVVIEQETETSISSSTYGIEGGFLQVTHELTVGGQDHRNIPSRGRLGTRRLAGVLSPSSDNRRSGDWPILSEWGRVRSLWHRDDRQRRMGRASSIRRAARLWNSAARHPGPR